jgi:hypothetical protein
VDLGGGCFSMGCYFNREAHLARGHKIIGAPFRKPDYLLVLQPTSHTTVSGFTAGALAETLKRWSTKGAVA